MIRLLVSHGSKHCAASFLATAIAQLDLESVELAPVSLQELGQQQPDLPGSWPAQARAPPAGHAPALQAAGSMMTQRRPAPGAQLPQERPWQLQERLHHDIGQDRREGCGATAKEQMPGSGKPLSLDQQVCRHPKTFLQYVRSAKPLKCCALQGATARACSLCMCT